ncbi:MAG: hypothetical protein WC581_14570 [Thermodesulfovibrionales bacterium]
MRRPVSLILAIILLITCSGCFIPGRGWVVPGDELPGDHDRGGHDGGRHDDRRDSDHHR